METHSRYANIVAVLLAGFVLIAGVVASRMDTPTEVDTATRAAQQPEPDPIEELEKFTAEHPDGFPLVDEALMPLQLGAFDECHTMFLAVEAEPDPATAGEDHTVVEHGLPVTLRCRQGDTWERLESSQPVFNIVLPQRFGPADGCQVEPLQIQLPALATAGLTGPAPTGLTCLVAGQWQQLPLAPT